MTHLSSWKLIGSQWNSRLNPLSSLQPADLLTSAYQSEAIPVFGPHPSSRHSLQSYLPYPFSSYRPSTICQALSSRDRLPPVPEHVLPSQSQELYPEPAHGDIGVMDNDETTTSHGAGLDDSDTGTNSNQAVFAPENEAPSDKPTSFINTASKSETSKVSDEEADNTPTIASRALLKSGNANDRDVSDLLRDNSQSIGHAAYGVLKILNVSPALTTQTQSY
jgi:hypothetical protein